MKGRDAWDCRDVGTRVSWCAGDERALASVLIFGDDQRFDLGEDERTVGEWGRRRELELGKGGVRTCRTFCLHLLVRVAVVGENAEWDSEYRESF